MENQFDLDRYWQAVSARVCVKCIDGDGMGNCRLTPGQECALQLHFPEVVHAVLTASGKSIEPYVNSLRAGVCSTCEHETAMGSCMLRIQLDCGLDRYLPMVVEAIEEVRREIQRS